MVAGGFVATLTAAPARASAFAGARIAAAPSRGAGNACREVTCMAKKAKDIRPIITLECTEQKATGVPGISRYTTEKNRRNTPGRLELMKFNKYLKKYTLHREIKK